MSSSRKPKEIVPVSIKPEDGRWYATSKYRPLLQGTGATYIEALEDLKDGLDDDINYNETMTSRIDGVNATIEIYAAENRSLDEFDGVDFEAPECIVATPVDSDLEDEQLMIEGQEIPQLPAAEFDRETCGLREYSPTTKSYRCRGIRMYPDNSEFFEFCNPISDERCQYLRDIEPTCSVCKHDCDYSSRYGIVCRRYFVEPTKNEEEEKPSSNPAGFSRETCEFRETEYHQNGDDHVCSLLRIRREDGNCRLCIVVDDPICAKLREEKPTCLTCAADCEFVGSTDDPACVDYTVDRTGDFGGRCFASRTFNEKLEAFTKDCREGRPEAKLYAMLVNTFNGDEFDEKSLRKEGIDPKIVKTIESAYPDYGLFCSFIHGNGRSVIKFMPHYLKACGFGKKDKAFGLSLHKQMIELISNPSGDDGIWFIFPLGGGQSKTNGVKTGDRVLVYETAAQKGRKAYVGEFRMGETLEVSRDDICSPEWVAKLQLSPGIISDTIGNRFGDVRVGKVEGYTEYDKPKMTKWILENRWIPKGLMLLHESYLEKLFQEVEE